MGEQVAAGLKENGGVAQLGEHLPCKQGVKSSNLSVSTVNKIIFTQFMKCSLKTEYRNIIKEKRQTNLF